MPRKKSQHQAVSLATFDDQLLDGFDFCRKAYDLFDQVRSGPEGVAKLRLRPTKLEKRLIEELIPIARYVQARYREGRGIKVRWLSGSQPYDAILWSSGELVKHGVAPRKLLVEVTTSVHENNYLARRLLHEGGPVFGVKDIKRDKKTKMLTSSPCVNSQGEIAGDLAAQIIGRLEAKAAKRYPANTVLIVYCVTNSLTLEDEWEDAMAKVTASGAHLPLRETFLVETGVGYSRTLYGDRRRKSARKAVNP